MPFLIWKEKPCTEFTVIRDVVVTKIGIRIIPIIKDITTHAFSCVSTQRTTSKDSGFSIKSGSGKDLQDEATLAILLLLSEENQQLYFQDSRTHSPRLHMSAHFTF